MKTELDFTRVPLDKWVDLYNALDNTDTSGPFWKAWKDVKYAAQYQVKEEADLNKEIVDKLTAAVVSGDKDVTWDSVEKLVNARAAILGIAVTPVTVEDVKRENALAPVEDIIK